MRLLTQNKADGQLFIFILTLCFAMHIFPPLYSLGDSIV